ncbi:uncharacterized protein TNIN_389541 [Trichonephila inaurata madagascariensis]|uniref:Shugoshin C-terminal domain-containing protein n=1 Tax=Trichonephila inaurata madagascariensis TaxID=2747483 RepID=A0A8X6WQF6_9ARAC|nr:uncharacterized protein TNIN_389541 [Trichonephila inaurata madagascariensis]
MDEVAANYKRRIKDLVRSNKELARSLQDVRCRVADQGKTLALYNQESTKMMYIKTKIKDMVSTVQKLVTDLDEVSSYMDGKTFDFLKSCSSSHDDIRLKILVPNITTIEESASTSTLEANISKDERINYEDAIGSVDAESKLKTRTSPRQNLITEICHLPTQAVSQDFSNLSGNERPRVSKSPEHPDSSSVDISKTPQPPVIPQNFRLRSFAASQNFLDHLKLHSRDTPSPSTVQKSPKVTTSKIPRKIPTSTSIDYPQPSVPLNQFSRRETFTVRSIDDEPQIPVLSTDRRGTFLLNPVENNQLNVRRATFLIPVQPKDPIPSPPKETETNPEVIVRNETIFLCEDMELTEILPVQNQFLPFQKVCNGEMESEGFAPIKKSPNVVDNLTSIAAKQISVNTELEKSDSAGQHEMPKLEPIIKPCLNNCNQTMDLEKVYHNKVSSISNILSEDKEFELSMKGINKEIDIAKPCMDEKLLIAAKDNVFIDSNIISQSETIKSVPTTDEQIQEPKLIEECDVKSVLDKNKLLEEKLLEKDLISDIESVSSKKKSRVSSLAKKKSGSTKLRSDRISDKKARPTNCKNQSTRSSKSPCQSRRSCKKQSMDFNKSSDSVDDEFDDNFAEDFTERKQYSYKLGRKIINPNNKRTFLFTRVKSINQSIPTDTITSASSDVAANEDNNIFDFSASSEAEKSPVMKPKKQSRKAKKSILPKKNSSSNKHFHTDKEVKEKDINLDEVFETKKKAKIMPRKSILCINKDFNSQQSSQSDRKSVRFTLKNVESTKDSSNSSFEINLASNEIELNKEIEGPVEQLSENCHKSKDKKLHSKKKYSPGRRSSLKATGTIMKNTNIKITNSKKQSYSSRSDSSESNLEIIGIHEEKNTKVSQKLKTSNKGIKLNEDDHVYLGNSEKSNSEQSVEKEPVITQENSSKVMSKTESDLNIDGKINQSPNENDIKIKKTKLKRTFSGVSTRSSRKRSTLDDGLSDLDDAIFSRGTLSKETKENDIKKKTKVKRTFSGVSNRSSKKRSTLDDDFLSDLDDAILSRGTLSKETKMPDNFIVEGATESYDVNNFMKLDAEKTSKKSNLLEEKALHNQGISSKKDNLNMKNVLEEIQPDNFSDVTQVKKILAVAKKKCDPKMSHNKVLKLDILTELCNSKNLSNNAAEKCNVPGVEKNVEKSKSKKCRKRIRNENEDPNSVNVRNVKSNVLNKDMSEDLEPLPLLQNRCASDIPCSTSPLVIPDGDEGRRSRRTRPVKSFKEPNLHTKLRR